MQQLRLQLLQPLARRLTLGDVAHEAGEEPTLPELHFADLQLHREGRAVGALADDDAADADDPPLSRVEIVGEISVMLRRDRATA